MISRIVRKGLLWSCLPGVLLALLLMNQSAIAEELRSFASEEQRLRYQALIEELRCPQCQNQNLEDSDSAIAQDLRNTVFRLLAEGKTDQQIIDYMIARYGDFITYLPRFQRSTLGLWLTPLLLVLVGGVALVLVRRQSRSGASSKLSEEEQQQLKSLLKDNDSGDQQ